MVNGKLKPPNEVEIISGQPKPPNIVMNWLRTTHKKTHDVPPFN
jgi:hypothetical protein